MIFKAISYVCFLLFIALFDFMISLGMSLFFGNHLIIFITLFFIELTILVVAEIQDRFYNKNINKMIDEFNDHQEKYPYIYTHGHDRH